MFAKVAAALKPQAVEAGYLELAEPTIGQAFDTLVARGVQRVFVVPVLLFSAGHAKRDIPAAIQSAAARHPGIEIEFRPTFGLDEQILALSRRRLAESLAGRRVAPPDKTYWLLVGRGSSDPRAIEDLARFANSLAGREGLARFGFCVVAASTPTLSEGLAAAATAGMERIVVQPHLLFRGAVLDEIVAAVENWRLKETGIEWVITAHLGPAQEVANAIANRVSENG